MANRDILTRAGVAAPLSATQHDQNMASLAGTVEEKTGTTYTVVYTDQNKVIELNNASMVCTLDAIATILAAIDTANFKVSLKNTNAASATINRSSTDTIDGATSISLAQNETVTLITNAAGTIWLLMDPPIIEAGSKVLFYQATAPTGWTRDNSTSAINDAGLRVVTTGTWGASHGATALSSVFGSGKNTGSTPADLAAHTHSGTTASDGAHSHQLDTRNNQSTAATAVTSANATGTQYLQNTGSSGAHTHTFTTGSAGSGGGHTHTLSLDLKYLDMIIASKD